MLASTPCYININRYSAPAPEDAHKPGCALDAPSRVRKIVVKALV